MIFATVNFVYLYTEKPLKHRKDNIIECFNEISIVLCIYVMHVFVNDATPAHFCITMGWVFMGIACTNILCNVIGLSGEQIYDGIKRHKKNKEEKRIAKLCERRLKNL